MFSHCPVDDRNGLTGNPHSFLFGRRSPNWSELGGK